MFQKRKAYLIPWLVWSVLYILVATSCCIYELTLGGTIVELTVAPILYILTIGSWIYIVLCIHSYFLSIPYERRPAVEQRSEETDAEITKPLVLDLREATHLKIFPKNVWDDGSSVSNFSQKCGSVFEVQRSAANTPLPTFASTQV